MIDFIQPILTILITALSIIMIAIIITRFGLRLKKQRLWYILIVIAGIFSIVSSTLNYSEKWIIIYKNLQLFSLATLFSGIAAIGAITQWVLKPLVFTTIDSNCSSDLKVKVVPEEKTYDLELYTYNASNITAKDIVVQAFFPPQVNIITINSPVGTHILKDRNGIELTFDTDRSYNPLNPNTHTSYSVKIKVNDLNNPIIVPIFTLARNMAMVKHSFILSTQDIDKDRLKSLTKNVKIPLEKTREKYFKLQKTFTIILFVLGLYPWIYFSLLKLFK